MLTKQKAKELCDQILKRGGKNPAEVLLLATDEHLTRFANNTIHQNVAERNIDVVVRMFDGKRVGMAITNQMDDGALDAVVAHARMNAEASAEDPDHPGLAEPATYPPIKAYDQGTAEMSPEERARQVGAVCRSASKNKLIASGAFSTGSEEAVIANSKGLFAYHRGTQADFQTVVMAEDASGRAQVSSWRAADIPVKALGQEAIGKAKLGRNPQEIEPGEYTIVVDPYVTQDLLWSLNFHGMGALTVQEGRSWMNDRMGEQIMSPQVSIWDDGWDPTGIPLPFDFEGVPKLRVEIVKAGVVKGPVYDRYRAQKDGVKSTGHSLPPTLPAMIRAVGPIATNLFMAPGRATLDEMVASTERGLYITRFWYTRVVHPRDCVVTGMTRDGVFMIENGKITYPVKNLRFTQSYVEALANVEAVEADTRLLLSEFGNVSVSVPGLKINGFNFTGTTV